MNRSFHSFPIFSLLLCFPLFSFFSIASSTTITLLNNCGYPIWPGILPNAGIAAFEIPPGGSTTLQPEPGWSGRIWAQIRCTFDPYSAQLKCNGPPATLAEFTIGSGPGNPDYYDVSLVDGFNVPMVIQARGGYGSCLTTGCTTDLNKLCPKELRVGEDGHACRSACEAFGTPEYCCTGAYASPATCRPSVYSQMFKSSCPRAYSYAYDDATSTFTCVGADYTITFCPFLASQQKSSSDQSSSTDPQTMTGFGFGFGSRPDLGSTTSSNSDTSISSSSGSDSNSRHTPKFFIGGGQLLPNLSPPSLMLNNSYFAWQIITLIIALPTLQFLCLLL